MESRLGKPRKRGDQYLLPPTPGHHRSPTSHASSHTGSSTFSYPTASPSPLKKLSTSSSSSGGSHVRWNSTSANENGCGGRLILSGEAASDAGSDATQVYYVSSYCVAELRTFHCERMRRCRFRGQIRVCLLNFCERLR